MQFQNWFGAPQSYQPGNGTRVGGSEGTNGSSEVSRKAVNVQNLTPEGQAAFRSLNEIPTRATLNQVRVQKALKEAVNYVQKLENKLKEANDALINYERGILDSDVTIEVEGGKEIYANKKVLQEKSDHFRTMFSHQMSETMTSKVKIYGADPEAVKLMLIHMISGRIPPKDSHYSVIVSMAELANRFALPDLLRSVSQFVETSDSDQTTDLTINLLKSCQIYLENEFLGALWQQIYDLCCLRLASRIPELRRHSLFAALTLRELIDILKLVPECAKDWHQVRIALTEGRSVSKDLLVGAAPQSEQAVFRAWVTHVGESCTTPRFQWIEQKGQQTQQSSEDKAWPVLYDFLLKHPWSCTEGDGVYAETVPMLPGRSNPPWREDRTVSSLVMLNPQPPTGDFARELEFGAAVGISQTQYIMEITCQWAQSQERETGEQEEAAAEAKPLKNEAREVSSEKIQAKDAKDESAARNCFKFSDPVELMHFISEVATDEGIQNLPNFKMIVGDSLSKYIIHTFDFFSESEHFKYLDIQTFSWIISENDLYTKSELQVLKAAMNWAMSSENEELLHEDFQTLFVFVPNTDDQGFGGKFGKITSADTSKSKPTTVSIIFEVNEKPTEYPISEVKIFRNPSLILPLVRFPYIVKKDLKYLQNLEWQILKSLPVMQELLQEALHLQTSDARRSAFNMRLKSHKILVDQGGMPYEIEEATESTNQEVSGAEGDEDQTNKDPETRPNKKKRKKDDLNQNRKFPRNYYDDKRMPSFRVEDVISCYEV